MPRRSLAAKAAAAAAADNAAGQSSSLAGNLPANADGDTSTLSIATDASVAGKSGRASSKAEKVDSDSYGIDDLLLPRTLTSRLARGILPPNTSIQKDALLALTKAATVFISYLASHSNDVTQKKTIGPQDVLKAIQEIEMTGVMGLGAVGSDGITGGRLERELDVWENVVRGKRKGYRDKVKARESGMGSGEGGSINDGLGLEDSLLEDENGERNAKRARVGEEHESASRLQNGRRNSMANTSSDNDDASSTSAMPPPRKRPGAAIRESVNGTQMDRAGKSAHDNEIDEDTYDSESESPEEDETQPEEDEEDGDDEKVREDDDQDRYGPDDQLRHDMNEDVSGEESD